MLEVICLQCDSMESQVLPWTLLLSLLVVSNFDFWKLLNVCSHLKFRFTVQKVEHVFVGAIKFKLDVEGFSSSRQYVKGCSGQT